MKTENFEDAMNELDTIVKRLEGGMGTLDQALKDFERATELVRFCNEQLSTAEKKIEILTGEETA